MAWCGVMWRGVVWRGVAWRGVAWRGVSGTLGGDGVLGAAGRVGLAAVAAGALQGVSAGAVDVQLEASGQRSGQLLVGVPVLLMAPTQTHSLSLSLLLSGIIY